MKKLQLTRIAVVVFLALGLSVAGCGDDDDGYAGKPGDIVGTWTGTWSDVMYSVTDRTISLTVNDASGTLSGTAEAQDSGSPTALSGTINGGTLTDAKAEFTVDFSGTPVIVTFDGTTLDLVGDMGFGGLSPFTIEATQTKAGTIESKDVTLTDGTADDGAFSIVRQ